MWGRSMLKSVCSNWVCGTFTCSLALYRAVIIKRREKNSNHKRTRRNRPKRSPFLLRSCCMWRVRIHQHNSLARQNDGSEHRVNKNTQHNKHISYLYKLISLFFQLFINVKIENNRNIFTVQQFFFQTYPFAIVFLLKQTKIKKKQQQQPTNKKEYINFLNPFCECVLIATRTERQTSMNKKVILYSYVICVRVCEWAAIYFLLSSFFHQFFRLGKTHT